MLVIDVVIHACKNIPEKTVFVENVWPANSALFIYFSTYCIQTVTLTTIDTLSSKARWCSGNASALGARGPG